jgi:uncharacterized protein with HEPN domain
MHRDDLTRTRHMLDYAERSIAYVGGRTRADLGTDSMLADALARVLEIIGEAAAQSSPEFREQHPEIPWAKAIGMRNRLIHAYPDVDLDILWSTVTEDIPPLIGQLRNILAGQSSDQS